MELQVNAKERLAASIGKPGEEDLYKFTVTAGGNHIVDTAGSTDVVMKLFGPNSQTSVIAEDDDSGSGTNARIVAGLIPGLYYVQVRHYNSAGGTGNYTVKVRRTAT